MRCCLSVALVLFAAAVPFAAGGGKAVVTFESPNKCTGNHGAWRWAAKTEEDQPPQMIPESHKVSPSQIGAWEPLAGPFDKKTPRKGKEKQWFALTGKVVKVKAEHDGDLHIVLEDEDGNGDARVIVEVPLKQHANSPWSRIRTTVFDWSETQFPFTLGEHGKELKLKERPVIRVVGKAFYDEEHASKKVPNRRANAPKTTVWEIHPVMNLVVLTSGG